MFDQRFQSMPCKVGKPGKRKRNDEGEADERCSKRDRRFGRRRGMRDAGFVTGDCVDRCFAHDWSDDGIRFADCDGFADHRCFFRHPNFSQRVHDVPFFVLLAGRIAPRSFLVVPTPLFSGLA